MAWIEQWKYSKVHKFQEEQQTKGHLNIINHDYHCPLHKTAENVLVKGFQHLCDQYIERRKSLLKAAFSCHSGKFCI